VKQEISACVKHRRIRYWNEPVLV